MSGLSLEKHDQSVSVSIHVANTGKVPGAQVVQIYAGPMFKCDVDVPVKQLVSFAKVYLEPGETKNTLVKVETSKLAYFSEDKGEWVVLKGKYKSSVGASVVDIAEEGEVTVAETFSFTP